jgi:hypothetical protein
MTATKPQINSLHDQTIQATIADPEYTDSLINVEIELDAAINPTDMEPVFGLNFLQHTDKGKILLENRDVYLSLSNFQYLSFSSCVLFSMVMKELSSKLSVDKAEMADQAKYVREQLSELIDHLDGKNETNK